MNRPRRIYTHPDFAVKLKKEAAEKHISCIELTKIWADKNEKLLEFYDKKKRKKKSTFEFRI